MADNVEQPGVNPLWPVELTRRQWAAVFFKLGGRILDKDQEGDLAAAVEELLRQIAPLAALDEKIKQGAVGSIREDGGPVG